MQTTSYFFLQHLLLAPEQTKCISTHIIAHLQIEVELSTVTG